MVASTARLGSSRRFACAPHLFAVRSVSARVPHRREVRWFGFILLSSTLAVATVAGMVVFTWLTLLGLQGLRLKFLENYEPVVGGGVFCALGLIIILFEQ